MNSKKKRIICVCVAFVVIIASALLYYAGARVLFSRWIINIEKADLYSVSFEPLSTELRSVDNITEDESLDTIKEYLKEIRFDGFISERSITRTSEMDYCQLLLAYRDKVMELQLTDKDVDQCYLRPIKGLFSKNVYVKLSNCQSLYDYAWQYILENQ